MNDSQRKIETSNHDKLNSIAILAIDRKLGYVHFDKLVDLIKLGIPIVLNQLRVIKYGLPLPLLNLVNGEMDIS